MIPRLLVILALLLSFLPNASPVTNAAAAGFRAGVAPARASAAAHAGRSDKPAIPPSPRDVLGFAPGEDRKLAGWSQIVGYFKRLEAASPRVSVLQPGLSTEQRPFIVAIVSSEENIRNLPRIKEAQRKLADPRLISGSEERERLIRTTPAVVAITCSIHSTEIVASQMSMELAYRLASDHSAATREILKQTVLVLVPSVNPDGIDIVTDWYRKTLGTRFEGTSPPQLYHHYTGHDDNRDWFMLTQVETQIVSRLFWREWFPEIVYDVHQQGQFGSRMCVPPFFDPSNPNIDPTILRSVGAIGMKMALNLQAAGYKGIVTNSTYDTWWHGGLRTAPYYHNSIGILTEAASVNIATPITIKREQLRSPTRGLADPLVAATNYPDPWPGGEWTMRDILNLELVATRTALEEAAVHHDGIVGNFVTVAERAIEAGKKEGPYAYIVPASQHDSGTTAKMIQILIDQGIEVHRAKSEFVSDGKKYPAGSYVTLMEQPYRANLKCLFEAQHYPDRRVYPGGPAEPPYDVAGWTLPMQMGVDCTAAEQRFEGVLERVDRVETQGRIRLMGQTSLSLDIPFRPPPSGAAALYLPSSQNESFDIANRSLAKSGEMQVSRLTASAGIDGVSYPAGTFVIESRMARAGETPNARMSKAEQKMIFDLAILGAQRGVSVDILPSPASPKRMGPPLAVAPATQPRLAVYQSWLPSMDEGWTRWVLEQFDFYYKDIHDADVRAGGLGEKYDVVILPDQSMQQIVSGNRAGSYPDEFTGGIGDEGVTALKTFVEAGGVLICLDSASELALKRFELPVKNVLEHLRRDEFYAPGSIFRATVDTTNPIGYGMPEQADLYFVSGSRRGGDPDAMPPIETPRQARQSVETAGPAQRGRDTSTLVSAFAFEITDSARARSVARYVEGNPLRSGWLLGPQFIAGKSALVDVSLGKGQIVLFGFRPQHRAQTWGTFKLLFNAILLGSGTVERQK